MTLLSRLVTKALNRLVDAVWPEPEPERREEAYPLTHRDVEHQQGQIREATGCCPFMRSGGFHGEDCYDQGREDCASLKRGTRPSCAICHQPGHLSLSCPERATSPRAIVPRPCIVPPPRPPRKR